jgi:hypothetical protein
MTLKEFKSNVQAIDFEKIVLGSAMESKEYIVDLNTDQLRRGLNSDGKSLNPELANNDYARAKKAQGGQAPLGTPDLFDTGDFHSSFYAEWEKDGIKVDATDWKTVKLYKKYEALFGLTENSLQDLGEQILPDVINTLKDGLTR